LTADIEQVSTGDRLSFALFMAAAVHTMLIFGVSFQLNSGEKIAPTLNITLATHQSKVAPEKADFLAQFDQEASGTAQQLHELTTRQKSMIADANIQEVTPIPQQKATVASNREARLLSTEADTERKTEHVVTQDEMQSRREQPGDVEDTLLLNPEIASLQAKLDRIRQHRAKQPRVRRLTSVATKASADAAYLNSWTQKIEQVGNENFPQEALQQGLFGNLRMSVSLHPNGAVARVEILQSSGHRILDDAAVRIVKLSSPFPPFPPEIRKSTDRLDIIRTWRFEIRGLKTSAGS
jgi:protein TonB